MTASNNTFDKVIEDLNIQSQLQKLSEDEHILLMSEIERVTGKKIKEIKEVFKGRYMQS